MTKKTIVLFGSFLLLSTGLFAQEQKKERTPEQHAEKMTNHLKEKLELDDKQYEKIKSLNIEQAKEMAEYREKMKALKDEFKASKEKHQEAVKAELTDEQKVKFEELKKEMKEKKGDRKKGDRKKGDGEGRGKGHNHDGDHKGHKH